MTKKTAWRVTRGRKDDRETDIVHKMTGAPSGQYQRTVRNRVAPFRTLFEASFAVMQVVSLGSPPQANSCQALAFSAKPFSLLPFIQNQVQQF